MSLAQNARTPPMVLSVKQLAGLLAGPNPPRILDATWFLNMPNQPPRNGHAEYLHGPRLPGALFWDVDAITTRGESVRNLPHMMPSAGMFAQAASRLGIESGTHVVVYDTHGIFSSPRAAFTFAAFGHPATSVLNGGLPAWEAEGMPLDSDVLTADPEVAPTTYPEPKLHEGWVRSFSEMLHNTQLGSRAQMVLDARPRARYEGRGPEPRPGVASGHIPSAVSLPFPDVLEKHETKRGSYTTLKPQTDLWQLVQGAVGENGMDRLRHDASGKGALGVSLYCGSGMTACVLWLVLQELGISGALYDESWMGWGKRVADGEAPAEKAQNDE
ncbi:hypothetical protein MSPP1_002179 [Malassezia sp. CBS 17886]|nr:hypothetical protein MSPP1_002179 [Malassezia sp. CBS 17886]